MQTNTKTARPGAERKRPDRKPKKQAPARKAGPQTAQQTIPYREIFKDGICRVNDRLYTKSMDSITQGRRLIAETEVIKTYTPSTQNYAEWNAAYDRFKTLS